MNIEEFVNYYLQNYRHEVLLNPYNGLVEFAKVFQEKLMKEAVEKTVFQVTRKRTPVIMLTLDANEYKDGDKVQVIICKKKD